MKKLHELVEVLEKIKVTDSTIGKKRYLRKFVQRKIYKKELNKFFNFVYSPYIVYNASMPSSEELTILDDYFKIPINTLEALLNSLENLFLVRKLRGNKAKDALIKLHESCSRDAKILLKMILDRDLDIGLGSKLINTIIPECIPIANYMGAVGFTGFMDLIGRTIVDKWSTGNSDDIPAIGLVEAKADGLFAFCNLTSVNFISRRLKEILFVDKSIITQLKKFGITGQSINELSKNLAYTLHGELTIDGISNRLEANGIFKALTTIAIKEKEDPTIVKNYKNEFKKVFGISDREMKKKIRYTVWDITNSSLEYSNGKRFEILKKIYEEYSKKFPEFTFIRLIEHQVIKTNFEDVITFFKDQLHRGNEGAVYKVWKARFEIGHSVNCIKFKNKFDFDLKVVGFEEGKRKNTLGALVCESEDGKVKTNLSGIDKKLKEEIWNNQDKFLGLICEGEANDITKSDKNDYYSLMHPRFKTFRDDKTIADNLQKIRESRDSFNLVDELELNLKNALSRYEDTDIFGTKENSCEI